MNKNVAPPVFGAGAIAIIALFVALEWYNLHLPAPSATVTATFEQAEKSIKAADTKIASATVQGRHVKAVVKVKAKVALQKLAVYTAVKKAPSPTNDLLSPLGDNTDKSVRATEAGVPAVAEVIAASDEALDACHEENVALQEESAALEVVIAAHEDKEAALENERELLKARAADLEKENARFESNLFWTHVGIGVAVVAGIVCGFYLLGVF